MAIITCPECGENVSDQALACIHCGFPIKEWAEKQKCDSLDPEIQKVVEIAKDFTANATEKHPDPKDVVPDIREAVEETESAMAEFSKNEKQLVYDKIASALMEAGRIFKEPGYDSWPLERDLFAMVDFSLLSDDMLGEITDYILSGDTFFNKAFINYWYPIYQILQNGSDAQKQRLMSYLDGPDATGGTKYDVFLSMVSDHLAETESGKAGSRVTPQAAQKNIPKCPTCGSTNIQKISTAGRVASTSVFGLASRKINKTFKCNNCGYTW